MLAKSELTLTFWFLYIYSRLHYLPFKINRKTAQIKLEKSRLRLFLWKATFLLAIFHAAYLDVRLLQSVLFREHLNEIHFPLHFVNACFNTAGIFFSYRTFFLGPEVMVAIFNELYKEDDWNSLSHGQETPSKTKSKQELLTKTLAVHFLFAGLGGLTVFCIDPSRIQLFYSLVPEEYKSKSTFVPLFILEVFSYMYTNANTVFILFVQLSLFEKLTDDLNLAIVALRSNRISTFDGIKKSMDDCRKFYFLINLFNLSQSHIIFGYKILSLSLSIIMGFHGIIIFQRILPLSVHNLLLCIFFSQAYTIIYDKAFKIPSSMKILKEECELAFVRIRNQNRIGQNHMESYLEMKWKLLKRKAWSIPNAGIKVGSFHTLERISTPNFIDFMTNQIAGLLVSFHKS